MSRSALVRWGGLVALAATATLVWWAWSSRAQTAPPPRAPADSRVPVIVAPVVAASDALRVEAVGTGLALRSATLQPAVAGEVASLHFKPGQSVRAGQVLLRLVDRKERLAAELAAAEVDAAGRLVDRLARTEGTGAVPGSVIDDARSTLQRAEIAQAQAREALADLTLRAPFDGVVGLAQVDPGDRVTPDTRDHDAGRPAPPAGRLRPARALPGARRAGPRGRGHQRRLCRAPLRGPRDADRQPRRPPTRARCACAPSCPMTTTCCAPACRSRCGWRCPATTQLQVPDLALQWGREGGHVWVLRDGKVAQVPVQLVRRLEGTVLIDGDTAAG